MSLKVMKWIYVNDIYVVAVQMGIDINWKILLIFEMGGLLFSSYTKDEPSCQIQRKPYWEIECDKYIRQVLGKSNIDTREFQFTCDRYHCLCKQNSKEGVQYNFMRSGWAMCGPNMEINVDNQMYC